MSDHSESPIAYWQPRVMRHQRGAHQEFAIHEVYFSFDDTVVSYTADALSPRAETVNALKELLTRLVQQPDNQFLSLGDLTYTYDRDRICFWLEHIDTPPIDYTEKLKGCNEK